MTVSRWERGESEPSATAKKKIRDLIAFGEISQSAYAHVIESTPAFRALLVSEDTHLAKMSSFMARAVPEFIDTIGQSYKTLGHGIGMELANDAAIFRAAAAREIVSIEVVTTSLTVVGGTSLDFKKKHIITFPTIDGDRLYADVIGGVIEEDSPDYVKITYTDDIA